MIIFHLFDKNEMVVFVDYVERSRAATKEQAEEIVNKWVFTEAAI